MPGFQRINEDLGFSAVDIFSPSPPASQTIQRLTSFVRSLELVRLIVSCLNQRKDERQRLEDFKQGEL